jgi:3'-5' exoribonuclease
MRRLYLNDCAAGDVIEDVLVVSGKQLAATASGKYYIKAFVSDRSGQITARIWNATREIFNSMPESGFLRLRGRVENYQNNLQVIIEQMWAAKEGTFEIADLIPHTDKDIPTMRRKVTAILGSLRNHHLADLARAYLEDEALMEGFCTAPAAMSFHHAFIGGLLEHTVNSMEVAEAVVKFYPGLNRDLVLMGIFLHDIAKVWELSYQTSFNYTDGGQLVGHIVKSAIWVEQKAMALEAKTGQEFPRDLVNVLQHIIVSHHGQPEFGAIKLPSTPEAIAVHYIENLDAKLMISLTSARGEARPGCEGNWSEYVKSLGGRLYRPDPAPADMPGPQPAAETSAAAPEAGAAKPTISNPLFESAPAKKK